jgi:hypothetical protein
LTLLLSIIKPSIIVACSIAFCVVGPINKHVTLVVVVVVVVLVVNFNNSFERYSHPLITSSKNGLFIDFGIIANV